MWGCVMKIFNHGQKREKILSIKYVENLLDKQTYPITKNRYYEIEACGEELRYYNLNYHMFFQKGYSCVECGLMGRFFALERSGGEKHRCTLSLYGINNNGDQVLIVASKIKKLGRRATVKLENIEPKCILCNSEVKHSHESIVQTQFDSIKIVETKNPTLFDGTPINESNIIGRCNNTTHWGWISEHLMKKHECLEKQCPFFKKVNPEYWCRIETNNRRKIEARAKAKEKKIREKERESFIRSVFKPYNDICITSIDEMYNGISIAYIYDGRVDLSDAIRILREKYNCAIYLKAVESSLENRISLIRNR